MLNQRLFNAINQQITARVLLRPTSTWPWRPTSRTPTCAGSPAGCASRPRRRPRTRSILFNFLTDRDCRPAFAQLEVPPAEFGSPQEVFKKVKEHERRVSEAIDAIADLAVAEKDHATRALMDWFATEQVEEQSVSSNIHARLKLVGGDPAGLLDLDRELGARVYVVPAPLVGKL